MLWENLREEEFKPLIDRSHGVCAFAIGCMEMHGQHLPLGTDTLKGARILEMAAEREEVCVFPRLYFGDIQPRRANKAGEGTHYGYIALSSELLMNLLTEICDEIARNGFKKILILSSHGGNTNLLGLFSRKIAAERPHYDVFNLYNKLIMPKDILDVIAERGREYFPALTDSDIAVLEDFVAQKKTDGHAGFAETAMLMGTYPELARVDLGEKVSGQSRHLTDAVTEAGMTWAKSFYLNYPNSYAGDPPVGLTQAIADAAVEISVERTVKALKLLKNDEWYNEVKKYDMFELGTKAL